MMKENEQSIPFVDATTLTWKEHPRIQNVLMKTLLTSADNPLANIILVSVPVGGFVSRNVHLDQVETAYVISGKSEITLDGERRSFNAGSIVAIPKGVEHELHNTGDEPVELLAIFTPPIA